MGADPVCCDLNETCDEGVCRGADAGCDGGVGTCPPTEPVTTCVYAGPPRPFSFDVLWRHDAPPYDLVSMTPLVVDVNRDGTPDVVATFYDAFTLSAVLKALDGRTGALLWESAENDLSFAGNLAAADLRGNGELTIVALDVNSVLVGYSGATGARQWQSQDTKGTPVLCSYGLGGWGGIGPAITNLDGQGEAEIVCGLKAFDSTGKLLWDRGEGVGALGPLVIAADLDGDGLPEVTDGASCFHGDGTSCGWTQGGFGGLVAAADFLDGAGVLGRDGRPELVVVSGSLALVDGRTGAVVAGPIALPSWDGFRCGVEFHNRGGTGGAPTIADFDGDGHPEVGVGGLECFSVFKLDPGPNPGWSLLWSKRTQDQTSSATGSTVFDFEGDGRAEVVYADENTLWVFDGIDGTVRVAAPHCNGTVYEYPVIVDVDGDGHANLVVAEAADPGTVAFAPCTADARSGIVVYRDHFDAWAPTRPIWNQHSYHVTNICDGSDLVCGGPGVPGNTYGRIPDREQPNWSFTNAPAGISVGPLNNYRQNSQGTGLALAPDVVALNLSAELDGCPSEVTLLAEVKNEGDLATRPGMNVAFYRDAPRTLLTVTSVPVAIPPKASQLVRATWTPPAGVAWPLDLIVSVDDDGTGVGAEYECNETNNELGPVVVSCVAMRRSPLSSQ